MDRSHFWTFVLITTLISYLIIGAFVFAYLEAKVEAVKRLQLKAQRRFFLGNNTCVSDADLEQFIIAVVDANNRGLSAANNVSGEPNWGFGQSLFFSATIVTTIGYGHVTPLSKEGKLFCIVYSIFGIPLALILFTALVERMLAFTRRNVYRLARIFGQPSTPTLTIQLSHVIMMFIFLVIFILMLPAVAFMQIEDEWDYLDAFYYCYISLTTIGLGDFIPGDAEQQQSRPLYKVITTIYLFIGLTFMMLTMAAIYDVPELNIGYHFYLGPNGAEDSENADASSGVTSIASTTEVLGINGSTSKHHQPTQPSVKQSTGNTSPSNKYQYDETSPLGQNGPYPLYQGYGRASVTNAD